ncbi:MAG: glycosyltransferase family 1 protein [Planctomycetes bacterium]|nr:glycosyltransferase family 1 protein [Planctomycetota bacterium]
MSRLHAILTPVGTSGDVHPFLGIGQELRRRGHDVTLVSAGVFAGAAARAGLDFVAHPTAEEYERALADPDLWHPTRGLRLVLRHTAASTRGLLERLEALHVPGRTVVVGHTMAWGARLFEEVHGAPALTIHLAPSALRSVHAQPAYSPGRDMAWAPRALRRVLWWLIDRTQLDPHAAPELDRLRAERGLPPVTRIFRAWISSPQRVVGLFPDWFGPPQPDWPRPLSLVGFPLFDDEGAPPSPALDAFLEAGAPPIAITPGTGNRHARAFIAAGLDAATRLGRRALVLTRYAEHLPPLPDHAHHEPWAPLARVLPRCAALVHHGGVGTCAQALAAGVPQVALPFAFDQPDNITRVARLGAGAWSDLAGGGRRLGERLGPLLSSPAVSAACAGLRARIDGRAAIAAACDAVEAAGRGAS